MMNVQYMMMSPQQANRLLEKNTRNFRKRRLNSEARIRSDIQNGRWSVNTNFIAIRTDGTVADGQTRLHAIASAGIEVPIFICFNWESKEDTIDVNLGERTAAQFMENDGITHAKGVASASRAYLLMFDRAGTHNLSDPFKGIATTTEIVECFKAHPGLRNSYRIFDNEFKPAGLPASILAAVHYKGCSIDKDVSDKWAKEVAIGEGLTQTSSAFWLRNRALRLKPGTRIERWELAALAIKSWNYSFFSLTCHHLKFSMNSDRPEAFPMIAERPTVRRSESI